jgi:AcrR family transcriptional regulator
LSLPLDTRYTLGTLKDYEQPIKDDSSATCAAIAVNPEETPLTSDERILLAAEELFSKHGFAATSIRAIAARANVALGQLHYYYPSKKELYTRMFLERAKPITAERTRLLSEAKEKYPNRPIPISVLIHGFVFPFLNTARQRDGSTIVQLHARLHTEPEEIAADVRGRAYDESTMTYVEAFVESLPNLPPETVYWRITFLIGAYLYTLLKTERINVISGGKCSSDDFESAIREIIIFLEAGLTAPAPSPKFS